MDHSFLEKAKVICLGVIAINLSAYSLLFIVSGSEAIAQKSPGTQVTDVRVVGSSGELPVRLPANFQPIPETLVGCEQFTYPAKCYVRARPN